jgi:IS605 OrfB family transposase
MLNPDSLEAEILLFVCQQASKLANCGTYLLRQAYFAFGYVNDDPFALHSELKDNPHFKILRSAAAQQILTGVAASFSWLTCVSNVGASFIVNGRAVKSFNRQYSKRIALTKKGKDADYWDEDLTRLTEKRNRRNRDAINKAARLVINKCLKLKIGTIVFGWNERNKDGINIGKKNNQEFVQIPTVKLKDRIAQLCQEYGIRFIETEESYTSKASALDGDSLPKYGEKANDWKPSGKRVTRGMYRTATGWLINADCNGALNILRKVEVQLGLSDLAEACRAVLTLPTRLNIWYSKRKKRRNTASARSGATA